MKILKEAEWKPSLFWKSLPTEFAEDSPYDLVAADGTKTLNGSDWIIHRDNLWDQFSHQPPFRCPPLQLSYRNHLLNNDRHARTPWKEEGVYYKCAALDLSLLQLQAAENFRIKWIECGIRNQ